MLHQTRLVAAKGLLYSMTIALVTLVSAGTLVSQEPQHPQPKPDTQQPDTQQPVNKAQANGRGGVAKDLAEKAANDHCAGQDHQKGR